ncbi:trifunctional histidinol dehydrogenase, partial [Physocladia obscura]
MIISLYYGTTTTEVSETSRVVGPVVVAADQIRRAVAVNRFGHAVWGWLGDGATVADVVDGLDAGAGLVVVGRTFDLAGLAGAGVGLWRVGVRVGSVDADVAAAAALPGGLGLVVAEYASAEAAGFSPMVAGFADEVRGACGAGTRTALVFGSGPVSATAVRNLDARGIDVLAPASDFAGGVAASVAQCVRSDRADGLVATVVADAGGVCLGLAYSSPASLAYALAHRVGAFHSRSRGGLWVKGATSGATQRLLRVDRDCDNDTLRFTVVQEHPGFCHNNTRTCFGPDNGITALYATLKQRKLGAPPGSYSARLFNDQSLLHAKIREEAQELCDANEKDHVAAEAADLLYFALVKCVASGIDLADVEAHLDARASKISRRPGNAKPAFL